MLRPCVERSCRRNHTMAHNTAKFGGAGSDVVVAKVAVSYRTHLAAPFHIYSQLSLAHSMVL